MDPTKGYLKALSAALAKGDATEHTHRPALKTFIESLGKGIIATNEPRRIACGAPDYIITKGPVPLGYIEAKDIGEALDKAEKSDQMHRYRGSLGNIKVRYSEPTDGVPGRVWINTDQCFEGVAPEVWDFHVGGYQVAQKWLKDRKGRVLNHDDLNHYRKIIPALAETLRLMAEVDEAIEAGGGWPLK